MDKRPNAPWWARNEDGREAPHAKSWRERYNPHVADTLSPVSRVLAPVLSFLTAVSLLGIFVAAASGNVVASSPGPYGSRAYIPSTSAVIAGCGKIFRFFPPAEQHGLFNYEDVARKEGSDYIRIPVPPMRVPAYGFMVHDNVLDHSDYYIAPNDEPPALESILFSMYHGIRILWYMPDANQSTIRHVQRLAREHEDVIAIPWRVESLGLPKTLKAHTMPEERSFAFSSWGVTQSCEHLSDEAFAEFLEFAEEKGPTRAEEPPRAVLTEDGQLPGIVTEFSGVSIP